MKKQTAVDYLQDAIISDRIIKAKTLSEWNETIKKAKDMEKGQIEKAYDHHRCIGDFESGHKYYEQTYTFNNQTPVNWLIDMIDSALSAYVPDVKIPDEIYQKAVNMESQRNYVIGLQRKQIDDLKQEINDLRNEILEKGERDD